MARYTRDQLDEAVGRVRDGVIGVNAASRRYGVPSRTIRRHLDGNVKTTRGPEATISPIEERAIVDGLVDRMRKGFPATRLHLKTIILDIISDGRASNFPPDGPSRQWIAKFIDRHNDRLSMRKARILDSSRINAVGEDEILLFFAEYEDFIKTHNIDATRIYNCDETGVDPQGGSPMKVVAEKGARNVSVRRGNTRENTSVLMTVSATGVTLPPLFIFKSKRLPSNLLHGAPAGSRATVSESAFIDTDIFEAWLDHFTKNIPPARPVLLLLDNHSAHVALAVRQKCVSNEIHVISFPPHTTHVLQPLDAGCFRAFKAEWRKVVDDWARVTNGQNIDESALQ